MEDECWKDISGFEGYYQVSNLGRVQSLPRITVVCGVTRPGKLPKDEHWRRRGKVLTPIHYGGPASYYRLYKEGQSRIQVSAARLLEQYFPESSRSL